MTPRAMPLPPRGCAAVGAVAVRGAASLAVLVLACGCGGATPPPDRQAELDARDVGTTVEPASEDERRVLEQLPELVPGKRVTIGSLTVVAERPYPAASGRTCRSVTLTASGQKRSPRPRLACSEGGSGEWFFVPDVFAEPVTTAR